LQGIEEEMNNNKKKFMERQPTNKITTITNSEISKFFGAIDLYKKRIM
jgi:hypothetical protein